MTEQSQLGPSYDGSVMLDIGGDIGALIIMTNAELHLTEIELSRVDGADPGPDAYDPHQHSHGSDSSGSGSDRSHGHSHDPADGTHTHTAKRTHVAVRERRGSSGVRYAAIYPSLPQGEYTVYDTQGEPADTARVVGGEVTQLDWR